MICSFDLSFSFYLLSFPFFNFIFFCISSAVCGLWPMVYGLWSTIYSTVGEEGCCFQSNASPHFPTPSSRSEALVPVLGGGEWCGLLVTVVRWDGMGWDGMGWGRMEWNGGGRYFKWTGLELKLKWREEDQLFKERKEYELDVRYDHVKRGSCFSRLRSIYLLLWLSIQRLDVRDDGRFLLFSAI
jgi:hypothetical protein